MIKLLSPKFLFFQDIQHMIQDAMRRRPLQLIRSSYLIYVLQIITLMMRKEILLYPGIQEIDREIVVLRI